VTRTDDTAVPDYSGMLRLDGRRVVVIGAGQGIGRQATHALAANGARVVCVDRDADLAADIAAEVGGTAWVGDVTDRGEVERLFTEADAAMGGVDGVVDIVGMAQYAGLLEDLDDELWQWHQDICLRHVYLAVQIGGRKLRDGGGGSMVFVASASGITGAPDHAAYGAAKAGVMSLVRSAAVELGPHGIRVNAVAPGVVWTPRVSGYLGERGRARNSENAPLRRVALPADIAAAILFFTSELSSYVSGQTLSVDGGVGVKFPYPMPEL
jgi:NAD(P)-dependent dehydrogenase (short-subunit alcohol dehydrogenase family)